MLSPPLSPGLTWNVLEAAPPPSIAWHLLCGHECTSLCWGCGGGERARARAGFAVAAGTFLVGSAVHQGIGEASGSSLGRDPPSAGILPPQGACAALHGLWGQWGGAAPSPGEIRVPIQPGLLSL